MDEPLGGDGGFSGDDDGGFGFGDGNGDVYDSDGDNIVQDDTPMANSMYLNHLKYTDLRIVSKTGPSQQSSPTAPTTSPSLDTGLASPSTNTHSTPTPPTPKTQLATPPVTPPNSRQKSPRTKKSAKSTPTRVGKLIHRLEEIGFAPDEVTLLGEAMVGAEGVDVDSLAKAYQNYVASDPNIKDVTDNLAKKHVKRMLHAANYVVLSAPVGVAFATQQHELLSLLFARTPEYVSLLSWLISNREVSKVASAYGQSLRSVVDNFQTSHVCNASSPGLHLGYRFLAIAKHRRTALEPAENMAWLFLFLHQLVYEVTAVEYPTQCGMAGEMKQQIKTHVNQDLEALSNNKFPTELSKEQLKNNKVCWFSCQCLRV
jgi:hypothetical protein